MKTEKQVRRKLKKLRKEDIDVDNLTTQVMEIERKAKIENLKWVLEEEQ